MSTAPLLTAVIVVTATLLFPVWGWLRMLDAQKEHEVIVLRAREAEESRRHARYQADRAAALAQARRDLKLPAASAERAASAE